MESYVGEEDEEEIDEGEVGGEGEVEGNEEEDDGDEGDAGEGTLEVGSSGSLRSGHARLFILPQIWTVNDFLSKMTVNIFKNLRNHYQIPENIPIRLPRKFEKCYSGKIANIGMYNTTFVVGLRLALIALHRQLANFLGLSVSQIAPNAWRIFIEAKILWGRVSSENCQLSLDEFFWCYKPQHIVSPQGIYHFATWEKALRLVSNMPDSNRNWKGKYFFVKGTD